MAPSDDGVPPLIGRKRRRAQIREDALALIDRCRTPVLTWQRACEAVYDVAWRAFCRTRWDDPHAVSLILTKLSGELKAERAERESAVKIIAQAVISASFGAARQQQKLLAWVWAGHVHPGLWRLDDILRCALHQRADDKPIVRMSAWLSSALRSMIEATHDDAPDNNTTPRLMAISIINHLILIAFPGSNPEADEECGQHSSVASIAIAALESLCSPDLKKPPTGIATVAIIISSIIKRMTIAEPTVAGLRVFLRSQVKRLLSTPIAPPISIEHRQCVEEALAAFQQCVSAPEIVQLFRQVYAESTANEPIEAIASYITFCATRDGAFRSHALAAAHELAHDGINASDALLLKQGLELAAAASAPCADQDEDDSSYTDWFRVHFAAGEALFPAQDTSRTSIDQLPVCLRHPSPGSATGCGLVSSKRHLQFVCAFLAEFDRSDSPHRRASHVLAHLSAVKTHQSVAGSVVAGLLSDFCSQTRHRFVELQSQEREAKARLRRQSTSSTHSTIKSSSSEAFSSQASSAQSQYTASTRSAVDELLLLYTNDRDRLMAQVNQWKIFKQQQWKQQLLPCCLDVAYWQSTGSSSLDSQGSSGDLAVDVDARINQRTKAHVEFVQFLAKHHAVGTVEYTSFVERVESWYNRQYKRHASGRRRQSQSNGARVAALREAVDRYDCSVSPATTAAVDGDAWRRVTQAFVLAFEELVELREADQQLQMQSIWELSARRIAMVSGPLDDGLQRHLALWIALLSSETAGDGDATPDERMTVMAAYCHAAVQQAASQGEATEYVLLGSLLGLLGSLTMCESIARTGLADVGQTLMQMVTEPVDPRLLLRCIRSTAAFVGGFVAGFTKNPTDAAPQHVVLRMLPPYLHQCLVWTTHHASVWWTDDAIEGEGEDARLWRLLGTVLQSASRDLPWFRLTCSPGVLTTVSQWRGFWTTELACCCLSASRLTADPLAFTALQCEQIESLRGAGQRAGVKECDVWLWIVETVLLVAPASGRPAPPVDALLCLLKETLYNSTVDESVDAAVQCIAEAVVSTPSTSLIHHALRCSEVLLARESDKPASLQCESGLFTSFFDCVASVIAQEPTSTSYEWVRALWWITTRVSTAAEAFASASAIPPAVFAHWAYEFPRLSRLRKRGGTWRRTAATARLLQAVQTCHTFYGTLGVAATVAAPATTLPLSQSGSQSASDGRLLLHVRSLEWLITRNLLPTPSIATLPGTSSSIEAIKTSLAFHTLALRVLLALLEDVAIGRPDDVAVELADVCLAAWLDNTSASTTTTASFAFQLLLVHMTAELCARYSAVSRRIASVTKPTVDAGRSLVLMLVLHVSSETEQLETVLLHCSSQWVNAFAAIACTLADSDASAPVVALLQPLAVFRDRVGAVLSRVLRFAVANQVDLLDAALLERMQALFPALQSLLLRVPVLNLASSAFLPDDFTQDEA